MEPAFSDIGLMLMIAYIFYGLIKSNYNENF